MRWRLGLVHPGYRATHPALATAAAAVTLRHTHSKPPPTTGPPLPHYHPHGEGRAPRAPVAPAAPPPPLLHGQPQDPTTLADWHDLMFFNFPTAAATMGTSAQGAEAALGPLQAGSLGIGEAMALSEAALNTAAQEAPQQPREVDAVGIAVATGTSGALPEHHTLVDNGDASFDNEADLTAFFHRHHSADVRGSGEAAMQECLAIMAGTAPYAHGDGHREHSTHQRSAAPVRRQPSSAAMLITEDGLAGDLVGKEEEQAALEGARQAQLVADAWQQYMPGEEELAALVEGQGEDVNGEDGVALEEDATERQAQELREQFWWQLGDAKPEARSLGAVRLPPPLRIPDTDGNLVDDRPASMHAEATGSSTPSLALISFPPITRRLANARDSFLLSQDRLYLAPQTPPAAQAPNPSCLSEGERQCVLVVFAANDLRVHDNYTLALASVRAHTAGGLPVVAVCVLDYRTFSQPSVVGGYFRQSPLRASFLLANVAALREKLETEFRVPLLVRVGRPEEHVPRLAVELGAVDVFLTTQYAPHERRVHDKIIQSVRRGSWVSRRELRGDEVATGLPHQEEAAEKGEEDDDGADEEEGGVAADSDEDPVLVHVEEHNGGRGGHRTHPYGEAFAASRTAQPPSAAVAAASPVVAVPHSVWQTTLVHLDDLPTPVAAMKEGERWYHDDVTTATIRPTKPYDRQIEKLKELPSWSELLPSPPPATTAAYTVVRGAIPTLFDLGYALAGRNSDLSRLLSVEEVVATQSSHPTGGEDAAIARVQDWLVNGGLTSMLRYGKPRRTNTKMYSQKLSRVSPYLAVGALSPRKFFELIRSYAHDSLRDGFAQAQYREALLRLSRRDYWHWMGLRFGDRLFYSYGPHPEMTDTLPDSRRDAKVVQKWCLGLTGIPFADAAMREMLTTGFVASEGRQALIWLLVRGYGQDWRLGAEWLERCSLDYDPFVCYGNCAYYGELLRDDFGETVRSALYLAHRHDQTGIYIKKWLPQLSKVPPVYIHRPHVMTPRMQAMHGVYLGKNYPYPLKLWDGAQRMLGAGQLPAYFAGDGLTTTATAAMPHPAGGSTIPHSDKNYKTGAAVGPGYAEAVRCGVGLMEPEELNAAVHAPYIVHRQWAQAFLPDTTLAAITAATAETREEEELVVRAAPRRGERAERGRMAAGRAA